MSEFVEIGAVRREQVGKANRKLAKEAQIPAVLYGHAMSEPEILSLDRHDFEHFMTTGGTSSTLVQLTIDGSKPVNAMIREVQVHPVKGRIQHVDFMAIKMNEAIATAIPLHFVGESAGVKAGGVLTQNIREIHVEALPAKLPEFIEVDITALEVGDNLHVADIPAPEGVTITSDPETIMCSVTPPTKAVEVEEVAEVEPEMVAEVGEETETETESASGE